MLAISCCFLSMVNGKPLSHGLRELAAAPTGVHAQLFGSSFGLQPGTLGFPRATHERRERQLCAWRLSWHCAPDHREGLGGGGQTKVFGDRERERETTQSTDGWKQRLRRTKMGITGLGDIGEAESREKESVCAGLRRQRRVGPCSKPTL